ncbi:sulfatase family protein [Salibacterium aidingense]|uniref:sulfatase family protein n=1 Tax=Salibacterium aidingense TaxID=384933 RepID=UPI003BE6D958
MRFIYIDVDSLRPDHLSCYGYSRKTSPNIDSVAEKGMRFHRCYAASSPCVPARASFMSGRYAINHGAMTHWGPGCDFYYPEGDGHSLSFPFFPRYLREAGYETITFSSFGDRHHAWWYFAGWTEVHSHTLQEGNENAEEVVDAVLPWLEQNGTKKDYFLHIQFWDPHTLYTCPTEYTKQWNQESAPVFPKEETIQKHQKDSFPRSASFLHTINNVPETMPDKISSRDDFEKLIDGYDGAIRYMDEQIGRIIKTLKKLGIEEEVAIIISADHGESLGEHGIYAEHAAATESVHHLPLIMKIPGVTKQNTVSSALLLNVDVMATLIDIVGLKKPVGWDGLSFLPLLEAITDEFRSYLVMDHALYTCQRAVRDERWYFIRTYHPGLYAFEKVSLYDMKKDPYQQLNVIEQHPETAKEMDHRLMQWYQIHFHEKRKTLDPMQEVVKTGPWKYVTLESWVEHLRKNNWIEESVKLEKKFKTEEKRTSVYGQ